MAEEILIKYKVDTTEFAKAETSVEKVTASVDELGQTIKVAFTQKSLDEAVAKLNEQGMAVEALVLQYGTAQKAFKGASKELIDMAARGEEGTKKFKDLQKAAAELQDTIEDTRGSIKKMSSDTRLIDSVAQGMRGLAAAGSVVAGAMATFGNENEAVQKTLLKVQGAMATLQGVQELATLATEKGGIATQAYGAALQVVDRISKLTGASMAASWALATAGITLVVGAIIGLIYWLSKEQETEEQIAQRKKDIAEIEALRAAQSETEIKNRMKLRENEYKQLMLMATTDLQRLKIQADREKELTASIEKRLKGQKAAAESIKQAYGEENAQYVALKNAILQGEGEILDSKIRIRDIQKQINEIAGKEAKEIADKNAANDRAIAEEQEKMRLEYLAQKDKEIAEAKKANDEARAAELQAEKDFFTKQQAQAADYLANRTAAERKAAEERKKIEQAVFSILGQSLSSAAQLANSVYSSQTEALQNEANEQAAILQSQREKQLLAAGEDAKMKADIEDRFAKKQELLNQRLAIKKAEIERKQAITSKAIALFTIAINTAKAISEYIGTGPAAPALIAFAVATGLAEAAVVAARPLPEIPTFEKGGPVPAKQGLLQGRSHREGGILINAQGGEYIWDIPTVKKHGDLIRAAHENRLEDLVLHKYVAPMLEKSLSGNVSTTAQWDDFMLRATIKQGHEKDKRNAEYIVRGITSGLNETNYYRKRFNS